MFAVLTLEGIARSPSEDGMKPSCRSSPSFSPFVLLVTELFFCLFIVFIFFSVFVTHGWTAKVNAVNMQPSRS